MAGVKSAGSPEQHASPNNVHGRWGKEKKNGADMVKYYFTSTETIGLLGTGAQDGHLDFHTAPVFCLC